ncbi:unnamed protein product [Didymodactylos carnosus]|uniref:Uncharacterized protein n=1 Tax=Didymodactylos carnosus TaxID=1234261 RepID=A0A8S2DML3_9BILA|nr:unnamed protein product [Didymodactylos carnosus]CAF3706041.1 unnamed protein product [Didymodactylos carnosus]
MYAIMAMDSVFTSLLGKRYTNKRKQAWSFVFQQIVVDLGTGVEEAAAIANLNRSNISTTCNNDPVAIPQSVQKVYFISSYHSREK